MCSNSNVVCYVLTPKLERYYNTHAYVWCVAYFGLRYHMYKACWVKQWLQLFYVDFMYQCHVTLCLWLGPFISLVFVFHTCT